MEPAVEPWPSDHTASAQTSQQLHTPTEYCSTGYKRMKIFNRRKDKDSARVAFLANVRAGIVKKQEQAPSDVIDYSDPFAVSNLMNKIESGKYGSVTKEIEALCAQKMQLLNSYYVKYPTLACMSLDVEKGWSKDAPNMETQIVAYRAQQDVIDLEDEGAASHVEAKASPVVIIDSDDEDGGHQRPSCVFQESLLKNSASIVLRNPGSGHLVKDLTVRSLLESRALIKQEEIAAGGIEIKKDTGEYVGVQDDTKTDEGNHQNDTEDDGLGDIWKEMTVVLECSKETFGDPSSDGLEEEEYEDCEHSFVLKDDLGYVCRICGVIQKRIENIFDFQYLKTPRSTRTYKPETRDIGDKESSGFLSDRLKLSEDEFAVTDICPHPRHRKQMKPHQVEGFNFLVSNLVSDNPGGCILAHAPGSGKTFMIISFMQSFLGKYPYARPLVVLPKGILATWKKEFEIWQVEDMPLLDFYSVKAENRPQQLEVLKQWVDTKSILFLGYKQFSTVICDNGASKAATACQEILLKAPTILILDEGHTPRNENTDVLHSLAKIQTPRKVVLSGTLYQNHVKEVFNILNLVRPKFLRLDASRSVVKRIMSKVQMSGIRKQLKANADMAFFDLVEHTLQKDHDFRRKVTVIQDLREMTSKVLHYYKGDFLEELPGLEDFTLLLKLSAKQKAEVEKLKKLGTKFKRNSVGSAVYMHPSLKQFSEGMPSSGDKLSCVNDEKMDEMLEKLNVRDGVKAKFYLNILGLCESTGEKMLVFSQYLLPLKFLERLTMNVKGWSPGKELFTISGDSSAEVREWSMDRFNNSSDAKVFFGSIKACGEGISLVGASRILVLDVHLNPSVTRQAIGRAFRPGQKKKVFTYRLVAANSPEEEDHSTCFRKELISKMWFEWNEYCGYQEFEVKTVDVKDSGDLFLESPSLQEDVTVLYRRLVS